MVYDQQLERRDVVIRGMWIAWKGTKALRQGLLDLGLTEAQGNLAFQDQPKPRTEKMIFETIQRCPEIIPIAELMLAQYIWLERDSRKEHYKEKAA
jgi:hypothetical protein